MVAKNVFQDWGKAYSMQRRYLKKGRLKMFLNLPANFASRLKLISRYLTYFPRAKNQDGKWPLSELLSVGTLLEIVDKACSPKLIKIMGEHKDTVDKYVSMNKTSQKHMYHTYINAMEQWNNSLLLAEKLKEMEAHLKCKGAPNGEKGKKGKCNQKRQHKDIRQSEGLKGQTHCKHYNKYHKASKDDCWSNPANKKDRQRTKPGKKGRNNFKKNLEKFQHTITAKVIKSIKAETVRGQQGCVR